MLTIWAVVGRGSRMPATCSASPASASAGCWAYEKTMLLMVSTGDELRELTESRSKLEKDWVEAVDVRRNDVSRLKGATRAVRDWNRVVSMVVLVVTVM